MSMPHLSTNGTRSASETYPVPFELGHLSRDVDAIEAGRVFAQDLALVLDGQIDVVFLFQILRHFERHELLDQPLRRPDSIVAAEAQLVGAEPKQQIGHDLGKIPRARMYRGDGHREPGIDVR